MEPIVRPGKPRLMLGLAAYGFREYFTAMKDKAQTPKAGHEPLDMLKFIDYAADQGCAGAELTSYYFPINVTDEYLVQCRHRAFPARHRHQRHRHRQCLDPSPRLRRSVGKKSPRARRGSTRPSSWGTSHVRVFAGAAPKGMSMEDATANCISAYKECADYAGTKGITLGMENHGGIVAEPDNILKIMHAVDSPWIGINFDSGNYKTERSIRGPGQDCPLRRERAVQGGDPAQRLPRSRAERLQKGHQHSEGRQLPRLVHARV